MSSWPPPINKCIKKASFPWGKQLCFYYVLRLNLIDTVPLRLKRVSPSPLHILWYIICNYIFTVLEVRVTLSSGTEPPAVSWGPPISSCPLRLPLEDRVQRQFQSGVNLGQWSRHRAVKQNNDYEELDHWELVFGSRSLYQITSTSL